MGTELTSVNQDLKRFSKAEVTMKLQVWQLPAAVSALVSCLGLDKAR